MADPGDGDFRLNHATQSSATIIACDHLDVNGTGVEYLMDTFDDSSSTMVGNLYLAGKYSPENWSYWQVSSLSKETGYTEITISIRDASEANPFTNGDAVVLSFFRTGDKGDTGAGGTSGSSGASGSSGSSGSSGATGNAGTSGSSGTSGTSGSSGAKGATGTSGSSGASGSSGSSGTSGSSGAKGDAGTSGSSGAAGTSGSSGASGASGTSGSSGASGY